MELIILQCDTARNKIFSKPLQDFYSYVPKEEFPLLASFGLRIIAVSDSTCMWEQLTNSRSRLTDGVVKSVVTVVSSNVWRRIQIRSQFKHCVSTQFTRQLKKDLISLWYSKAVRGGLVVSLFATGPTELAAAGSGPAKDGGFLWAIKIRSAHFLRRGSKAVGPMS
jgi:hypothetical protein